MADFGGIDSVIHHKLRDEAEKETEVKDTITIAGVELDLIKGVDESLETFIPEINEAYEFQEFTADVIADITCKPAKPVLLIGHTGTGKTSCYYELAARIGQPVKRINLNHQTTISDFVGMWGVKAGETYWIDGVLPWAMRTGAWLILDELDFADPAILSVLNGVLEPGEALVLKEKDHEVVQPHPNFRILATGNAIGQYAEFRGIYQGTNIMNEAFLDRWKCYIVDYLPEALEIKVLENSVRMMSHAVAKEMVRVASAVRKAFAEETVQCTFSTRRLLDWGEMIIRHRKLKSQAPFKAAESVIFSKISREDGMAIKGFMQRILLGRDR
jgi:cobaltochelatase CobS